MKLQKVLLKLMQNSKSNHFNNYFLESKLNLFSLWEGIREVITISKKGKTDLISVEICNELKSLLK